MAGFTLIYGLKFDEQQALAAQEVWFPLATFPHPPFQSLQKTKTKTKQKHVSPTFQFVGFQPEAMVSPGLVNIGDNITLELEFKAASADAAQQTWIEGIMVRVSVRVYPTHMTF